MLPVWLLLAPRDYLSTFLKIGTVALLAIGILVAMPDLQDAGADAIRRWHRAGVRRLAVPVPVHHDRVRRRIGLAFADRIGHDAEAARE